MATIQERQKKSGCITSIGLSAGWSEVSGKVGCGTHGDISPAEVGQRTGHSGSRPGSDGVVWRCNCGTSNHISSATCASCGMSSPSVSSSSSRTATSDVDRDPPAPFKCLCLTSCSCSPDDTTASIAVVVPDPQEQPPMAGQPYDQLAMRGIQVGGSRSQVVKGAALFIGIFMLFMALFQLPDKELGKSTELPQTCPMPHQEKVDGWNALMEASYLGSTEIVNALLKGDVNVDWKDKCGRTAFYYASSYRQVDAVKVLLADGRADVNYRDENGYTALMSASLHGEIDVVRALLIDGRVDVNIKTMMGKTALMMASEKNNTAIMAALLADSRVDVNIQDTDGGFSAFHYACFYGHTAAVHLLLAVSGLKRDSVVKSNGRTALMIAIQRGHIDIAAALIAHGGVDINVQDQGGKTGLMLAIRNGQVSIVPALVAACNAANLNVQDKLGMTAFMWASTTAHTTIVRALLSEVSVDVNKQTLDGWTALMLANYDNNTMLNALALISDNRTEINTREKKFEWSALWIASVRGHTAVVLALLAHSKIDVNAVDKDGWTPLMLASVAGRNDTVAALLADGRVNLNVQDTEGNNALMLACSKNYMSIVQTLLRDNRIDVNAINKMGWTAVVWAVYKGHASIVDILLSDRRVVVDNIRIMSMFSSLGPPILQTNRHFKVQRDFPTT